MFFLHLLFKYLVTFKFIHFYLNIVYGVDNVGFCIVYDFNLSKQKSD